ncbi:MAG: FAD-binding protein [Gemmatimonadota bacterium]
MGIRADYLIVGSGVAGLYFALKASEKGSVVLITKRETRDSNTVYAQGGIASVTDGADSLEMHVRDTLAAGDGLCHQAAVEAAVHEGPAVIDDLIEIGTRFSRTEEGELSLGREGGHSQFRIVHADDLTGQEVSRALVAAVKARVHILEHHLAADLVVDAAGVCRGIHALDLQKGNLVEVAAPVTMLATGGAGQVYASTTNPAVATGDGVAMAYRAGATVGNMEFFQFHPHHALRSGRAVLPDQRGAPRTRGGPRGRPG